MRTQNPPPLKACRFDSDLGHHHMSGIPFTDMLSGHQMSPSFEVPPLADHNGIVVPKATQPNS